jgi:hypothetical protein
LRSGVLITGSRRAGCLCGIVPSHATNGARGRNDGLAKSWRRE